MNNYKNNILTGLIAGVLAPAIAFIIFTKIKQPHDAVMDVVKEIIRLKIVSVVLSFAAFVNLIVFFIFLRLKADTSARGVLMATMIYALAVFILKVSE